jgi:hypothetical protein
VAASDLIPILPAGSVTLSSSTAAEVLTYIESALGTAATQNTGTSGANVPLLNGANTWSVSQTLINNSGIAFTDPTGYHPLLNCQTDADCVFYVANSSGASENIWSVYSGTLASPVLNLSAPGGVTVSQSLTVDGSVTIDGSVTVAGNVIGTAAYKSTGTSGAALCLLSSSCTYSGPVTISASNSTSGTNYLSLVPTDFGAGKPGLYFFKSATANGWLIDLYDGSGNGGTLGLTAGTIAIGGNETVSGSLTVGGNAVMEGVNNLSDVASAASARSNLGLGNAATQNVGTTSGTVAAGNMAASVLADVACTTTGCTVNASSGVSSVTRLGTGQYQVNFSGSFADANYVPMLTLNGLASSGPFISNKTTGNIRINLNAADGSFELAIFGQ